MILKVNVIIMLDDIKNQLDCIGEVNVEIEKDKKEINWLRQDIKDYELKVKKKIRKKLSIKE